MENLSPAKRGQVMEVVDELGETMNLDVLILVDTSASMRNKLPMVQEALTDLSISLTSRMGANRFALYSFPGKKKDIDKLLDWSPQLGSLQGSSKSYHLVALRRQDLRCKELCRSSRSLVQEGV